MKTSTIKSSYVILIFCISTAATPAYAYLDPGTGSLIIQGVIGTFALAAATVTGWWNRIKLFFMRKSSEPSDQLNSVNHEDPANTTKESKTN